MQWNALKSAYAMPRDELLFGVLIACVHGGQHVFLMLLPPIIPILVVELDAPLWQLGLLFSVYLFVGGLAQAPMGVLSDRHDRKYLLVPAFVAMGVGYLLFVTSASVGPSLPDVGLLGHTFDGPFQLMALGMAVAGLGYSVIHPVGYPLITSNISVENKGKVLGMWGSASKFGDATAPLLVAVLILLVSWEAILVGVSSFGFVFAAVLYLVFRRGGYETLPPDPDDGAGVEASLDGFRRHPRSFLFPMAAIVGFFFCILFTINGVLTFTPVFVTDTYGYSLSLPGVDIGSASLANLYFASVLISGGLAQLVVGGATDVYDYRAILVVLLLVATVGLLVISMVSLGPVTLLGFFVVLGVSLYGLNPARDALISMISPPQYEGRTFGYVFTLALVVGSAYPVLIGYLADTHGLRVSFALLTVGSVGALGCIGALYSSRVYREHAPT